MTVYYVLPGERLTEFVPGTPCYGFVRHVWRQGIVERETERCVLIQALHENRTYCPQKTCVKQVIGVFPENQVLDQIRSLWVRYGKYGVLFTPMNHAFLRAFFEVVGLDLQRHNRVYRTRITPGLASQVYDLLDIEEVGNQHLIQRKTP